MGGGVSLVLSRFPLSYSASRGSIVAPRRANIAGSRDRDSRWTGWFTSFREHALKFILFLNRNLAISPSRERIDPLFQLDAIMDAVIGPHSRLAQF